MAAIEKIKARISELVKAYSVDDFANAMIELGLYED